LINMKTSYCEDVSITRTEPMDILEATGRVWVTVNTHNLLCFSSNFSEFISAIKRPEIQVSFSLMTTECAINKEDNPIKRIESFRKSQTPNHCVLTGTVTEIIRKQYSVTTGKNVEVLDKFYGIVDCGIHVVVELFPSKNFHVGDIITAEGRLDICII